MNDENLQLAGPRLSTFDPRLGLSVQDVSKSYGDHHHGSGDLVVFPDAASDQFRPGLVVGDHVQDGAGVLLRALRPDATAGDGVAAEEEPEIAEGLHRGLG